jgi:hypothetical protein
MPITKSVVQNMRLDIDRALVEVSRKYGVSLSTGNATFTSEHIKFKLNAAIIQNGVVVDPAVQEFKRYATMYGIPQTALGTKIQIAHRDFIISGFCRRKRKFPVMAKDARSGRMFKLSVSQTLAALQDAVMISAFMSNLKKGA